MGEDNFAKFWVSASPKTNDFWDGWSSLSPISFGLKSRKKMRVIFNDPATILFVDDEKFVSKAHNEEFDEEKGLLMCIAKANGISHLELKRMIKNAQRPENKKEKKEDK